MIEFRTLGTIELLRPDGTLVLSVASRSKALGLLAYLVLSEGDGARRREDVCALLWPESDESRARNSLNQTLHTLRSSLGNEVVTGGRETVGVEAGRIRCDAVEFRKAIAAAEWEKALELYGGELLPGLHVTGSLEFERWLDHERRDLKRAAFDAARRAASQISGDDRSTIRALRKARKIRPDDDETVRDLMAACQRQGNVAAALQEYESYRTWLSENVGLDPPEGTRNLAEDLRTANGNGIREPFVRSADPRRSTGDLEQPPVDEGGRRTARRRVAVGSVAVAAAVTLLLLSGGPDFLSGDSDSASTGATGIMVEPDPYRIAVLPLRTAVESDRAAAVVLGDGLNGWAELRQIEANRIDARIASTGVSAVGPEYGSTLATDMGAGRFVLVRSERNGPEMNVRAVLYESGNASTPLSRVDTTGTAAGFSDDWYVDVLLRLFRDQDLGTTADLQTAEWIAEPRAMFPYFSALARFSHGQSNLAMSYLQQAVALDTTFGAAWNLLAGLALTAVPIASDDWEARDSLRAIRDTAMVYAELYYSEPESGDVSLAQARRLAELFSDSAQLQHSVGAQYLRAALERGFDADSALPYWERAFELEPRAGRVFRLAILHLEHGRLDEARAILRQADEINLAVNFGDLLRTFLDIVGARSENARDSILYAAEAQLPYISNFAVARILVIQDSISISRHILETIGGAWYLPPNLELVAGRGSALPGLVMEEGRRHDRFRALANVPGLLNEPAEVVSTVRDSVVHMGIRWSEPGGYYSHWTWQLYRLWLLSMMSVRLEEFDQAEMWVDSMTQLAADSIPPDAHSFFVHLGQDLPVEVRAAVAAAQGNSEKALALLDSVHIWDALPEFADPVAGDDRMGQPDLQQFVPWQRPFTRLTKANLLLELGRYEEAEGWFATFPQLIGPWDQLLFQAPAFRGRAEALDALGRYDEALHFYRRFVLRWNDADSHLQPQVEAARQRIRELEAELVGS